MHFFITFGIFDGRKRLILKDVSTRGTAVAYSGQAREEVRNHFIWILDLEKKVGEWEVEVFVPGVCFKVELASHQYCSVEYDERLKDFLQSRTDAWRARHLHPH